MWELSSYLRTWTRHWWTWGSSLTRHPSPMRQTQSLMCWRDIWSRLYGQHMALVMRHVSQVCGGRHVLCGTQPRTGSMMVMRMKNGNHDSYRRSCEEMVPWPSHARNQRTKKLSRLKKKEGTCESGGVSSTPTSCGCP